MVSLAALDTSGTIADYARGSIERELAEFRLSWYGFDIFDIQQMLDEIDELYPDKEPNEIDEEEEEGGVFA
tara:strand:- start:1046 stop:1258 length:213 start_codon:yes stop_codon:yes gene_type:complete